MNQADGATAARPHFTFSLLHTAQMVADRLEAALGNVGLSMAKQSALSRLAEAGEPMTLGDLAEQLSCVRSNITQLVDRLEADDLVRRVNDPSDRRSVRAELTELGIEKQAAGAAELLLAQEEMSARMSMSHLAALDSALLSLE
ncbi:MAG: MarR family transcriptional regulator [Gemmatimonadaceae bacterium]